MRQYKGESRDEWERMSCPGDVQPRERPEREYNPDDDPLWGLRGAEREAARERLFGPGQVPVELLATAATARTAPAVDPVLEAASLARGYAVLVYDAERLLDEIPSLPAEAVAVIARKIDGMGMELAEKTTQRA